MSEESGVQARSVGALFGALHGRWHNAEISAWCRNASGWLSAVLKRCATFIFDNFYNFIVKLPWVVVVVVVAAILIRGLTEYVTVVESISVPKALLDRGYTPEVAARHLRDAVEVFGTSVKTGMRRPDIALHGELPDIIVPSVGISLDAVVSSIRTMLRSTRSRTIAGEFTIAHDHLWLRLRLDGHELYSSPQGGDPEAPDELLKAAAPTVLVRIQPYFEADLLYDSNPDGALEVIDRIIVDRPEWDENVARSYNLRSVILGDRKDFAGAQKAVEKALQLDPRLADAHVNLALLLKDQGQVDRAIVECREAIKLDPKRALYHYDLGVVLSAKSNNNDEALAAYREAIRLDPKYGSPHDGVGEILREQGKTEAAIGEYRTAIRLDPKNVEAHFHLGEVLGEQHKHDEAISEYREAIRLDPNNAQAHSNLGGVLNGQGKNEAAIAEYREAIRLDPKNGAIHSNLGLAFADQGKNKEAIAEYREAIRLDPNNAVFHYNFGNTFHNQGKNEEAVAEYREAVRLDPNHAWAHNNLAVSLLALGKNAEAITEYRAVLRIDPNDSTARGALDALLAKRSKGN